MRTNRHVHGIRIWQGVRMRQVEARACPDAPARLITLPCSWDDRAASALAELTPGTGPASLAAASAVWLAAIGKAAQHAVLAKAPAAASAEGAADTLLELLCARRVAPTAPLWRGDIACPGFVLNLAAFHEPDHGFDTAGFERAAGLAARICRLLAPDAAAYELGIAGLDDLLAILGIGYGTPAARRVAAALAALFRGAVEHALEAEQRDLLASAANWPNPLPCIVGGLSEAARSVRETVALGPVSRSAAGVFAAGAPEALLGVETGGIAPAFAPVRDGVLTRAAQHRLAAASLSPEAALAASLCGDTPLPIASPADHAAMHEAVAPYLQAMPPHPLARPLPAPISGSADFAAAPGRATALPARRRGLMQKAIVGGHTVFLRTGEYPDGRLGEIEITLPREAAALRGTMDALGQAVSIGLQQGAPLDLFVDAFAGASFGPAGAVEGDLDVAQASSIVDYVFRSLSATYLSRRLPDPAMRPALSRITATAPLLPLDLPTAARRRNLRLVA